MDNRTDSMIPTTKSCQTMRRVSSRPRLVSWDAFDANDDEPTVTEDRLPRKQRRTAVELNDDVWLAIASFGTVKDIRQLSTVNIRFRRLILSDAATSLHYQLIQRTWPFFQNTEIQSKVLVDIFDTGRCKAMNVPLLLQMAATPIPTAVNLALINRTHSLEVTSTGAVQFTGRVGQGDRCVVANQALPRPRFHYAAKKAVWQRWVRKLKCRPFVAPFGSTTDDRLLHCMPRTTSYFEVDIIHQKQASHHSSNNNNNECVAVGIGTRHFGWSTRMPGWDSESYGYHGDDGGLFHGSGQAMRPCCGPQFGAGDTVGCGIDYYNGGHADVFFTVNGQIVASQSMDQVQAKWYPIVGMDTSHLIVCRFTTFAFDLAKHIWLKQRAHHQNA